MFFPSLIHLFNIDPALIHTRIKKKNLHIRKTCTNTAKKQKHKSKYTYLHKNTATTTNKHVPGEHMPLTMNLAL